MNKLRLLRLFCVFITSFFYASFILNSIYFTFIYFTDIFHGPHYQYFCVFCKVINPPVLSWAKGLVYNCEKMARVTCVSVGRVRSRQLGRIITPGYWWYHYHPPQATVVCPALWTLIPGFMINWYKIHCSKYCTQCMAVNNCTIESDTF